MTLATAAMLLLGGAVITWEAMRQETVAVRVPQASVQFDAGALQEVLADPRVRVLVPLAPPVVPTELGNPAPFPVPERAP